MQGHRVFPGIVLNRERECGGGLPRRRCNVVDIAKVPQDHEGSGVSRWIAILGG